MAKRVGVIGGGQLARMMTPPAINLGLDIKVLAETENSSAVMATTMVGDYNRYEVVEAFAKTVDVITFDHEHVPLEILRRLEQSGVSVQPPSRALAFAQNKLEMRARLSALGLPMPIWAAISSATELQEFLNDNGGVCILKTPIGGYDGKGVRVIKTIEDAADWLEPAMLGSVGGLLLAEEKVNFVRELAQLSARRPGGEFATWPLVQTVQANGVCSEVLSPAPGADHTTLERAAEIARGVAEGLGVTGVLAVELFETPNGRLLINELAMRPHNSGHFSIEGSTTSQFEQHLRAVLDLPLGSTAPTQPHSVMVNLLGVDDKHDFVSGYEQVLSQHPSAKVHTYGKAPRAGRKMGHVTVVGQDSAEVLVEARATAGALLQG